MLSRVADAVFWMARYMERTDNILRVLRTNYIASQDEIQNFDWNLWIAGLGCTTYDETVKPGYRQALFDLLLQKENDTSVLTNIVRARENARSVQDYITKEVWQCMNDYYHLIREKHTEYLILHGDPVTAFDNLLRESTLFYGTVDITLNRGEGYTFLNMGKYIERMLRSLDFLELKIKELEQQGNELVQWKYLLYALSGYEFHTKYYRNTLSTDNVLHQVMLNVQFPHSVLYCMQQVERYFKRLDSVSVPEHFKEMEFLLGKAISNLRYGMPTAPTAVTIKPILQNTRVEIKSLSQKLAALYFGYS
ncbi:MAG: alpha-E domain-containing protein [Cyclobacteriaceae bacterium]|nr:alpha-E domain-containing protein [Cytophagales bacterium]MBX2901476.1 alpha-E domain-containing protein [Cyclobacteriaceae bacterium]